MAELHACHALKRISLVPEIEAGGCGQDYAASMEREREDSSSVVYEHLGLLAPWPLGLSDKNK